MNTRKALEILSKGDKVYSDRVNSPLLEKSDQYLSDYDDTQRNILAKQNDESIHLPFLDTLRRKVSKMIDSPDVNLPIVTRFDLYSGIRKASEKSKKDSGLKRLAAQLEKNWHNEPLGTMTYGQVAGLIKQYKDMFPRSKAADAMEAECTRIGLHKLPVAKLARIASNIGSQADYDVAMEINGFAGDRPEQIRARALVRGLVELRGASVGSEPVDQNDSRGIEERVADKVTVISKQADYAKALQMLPGAQQTLESLMNMVDSAANEMFEDGLNNDGQRLQSFSKTLDQWSKQLQSIVQKAQPLSEEQVQQKLPKSKPAPQSAPKQQPSEQGEFDHLFNQPQKKWYNPLTWFKGPQTASLIKSARSAAAVPSTVRNDITAFMHALEAQLAAPPMHDEDLEQDNLDMSMPDSDQMTDEPGLDLAPAPDMDMEVQPSDLEHGVDVVEEIEQAADDIIQEAPPEAMDYIDHEMAEGHSAPPGTAEWGAEEILNEGHEAPPPTDAWLDEEMAELEGGGLPGPGDLEAKGPPGHEEQILELKKNPEIDNPWAVAWSQHNKEKPGAHGKNSQLDADSLVDTEEGSVDDLLNLDPRMGQKKSDGKGIPLPGKVETHPKVTTYAKNVGKDGGKVLKSADIEQALLDGHTVKVGSVSIAINSNDEIEVWNKDAGRACDLMHMDTAVADFIAMADAEQKQIREFKSNFKYHIAEMVNVPCEACGNVHLFEKAANINTDQYACLCGNLVDASSVEELLKIAQWGKAYQVSVQYPVTKDPQQNKVARDKLYNTLRTLSKGNMKVDDEGSGFVVSTMWNVEDHDVAKIERQMQALGARPESRRVGQALPGIEAPPAAPAAPAPSAPSSAEGPLPVNDDIPGMPFDTVANAAWTNYKALNMSFHDAAKTFLKEHGEKWADDPSKDSAVLSAMMAQYGGTATQAAPPAPGAAPMSATPPPGPGSTTMMAALKLAADSKLKTPSIRKPKDHVSVPNDVGPDSETKGSIPAPGKVKSQPNKEQHQKLSPKDLGKDSETKDLLPTPGEPKAEHDPKKNKGVSLPDKKLDKDSEPNDPFSVPSLGKAPKVNKG